jgi:hypothetical protein
MQTHWDSSPDNVRTTYGEAYFEDFKVRRANIKNYVYCHAVSYLCLPNFGNCLKSANTQFETTKIMKFCLPRGLFVDF